MSNASAGYRFALIFWLAINDVSPLKADEPKPESKAITKIPISIQLRQASEKTTKAKFVVSGVPEKDLQELARSQWKQEQWTALFFVSVDNTPMTEKSQAPPVIGSYRIESKVLIFEPRFRLSAGLRFRAVFEPARLPGSDRPQAKAVVAHFTIPKVPSTPTAKVDHVYPTRNVLPENLLKFYIHFSAPMSKSFGTGIRRALLSSSTPAGSSAASNRERKSARPSKKARAIPS
jgi:hypothetical protein